MPHIFISYSRKDGEFAQEMVDLLRLRGVDAWIDDERIGLGDDWTLKIENAIRQSDYVVPLLTPNALQSEWIYREINRASELNKTIVPILIGEDKPTSITPLPNLNIDNALVFHSNELTTSIVERLMAKIRKPEPVTS